MIRAALITLAFALAPGVASALILPDCAVGDVEYYANFDYPDGLVTLFEEQPMGERDAEWLIHCPSGMAVRSWYDPAAQTAFEDFVEPLIFSETAYTLSDVAKLARDANFEAEVLAFPAASCICNRDGDT
ncbi:MAG TPA: hypothetical protein ENK63_03075 [Rhodobacterales bacterium]|nr:hypothetical protein [Rhodobacterales bacterium]